MHYIVDDYKQAQKHSTEENKVKIKLMRKVSINWKSERIMRIRLGGGGGRGGEISECRYRFNSTHATMSDGTPSAIVTHLRNIIAIESNKPDVGECQCRYPLNPRLDGIFIHLTKVCGVNTSQQWSISDQVAPRPTPIVTSLLWRFSTCLR